MRLIYRLRSDQLDAIDEAALHQALSTAHSYTMQTEFVTQPGRSRLPELRDGILDPLSALAAYLNHRQDLQELQPALLATAQTLLEDEFPDELVPLSQADVLGLTPPTGAGVDDPPVVTEPQDIQQLRLL
jgi:exonuclease SbcD